MSERTDKVAHIVLGLKPDEYDDMNILLSHGPGDKNTQEVPIDDLQSMAEFWLMRDELLCAIDPGMFDELVERVGALDHE